MTGSPFPSSEIRRLVRELAKLQAQVTELQAGMATAGAGRSSLDGGTWVVKDANGVVRQVVGSQGDGTFTTVDMNGGQPPTPTTPVVVPVPGGLRVSFNGTYVGSAARPADLAWIEVHVDLDPDFDISEITRDAALTGKGSVTFATDDYVPHTVRLVAINTSGVRSVPSGAVTVTPGQIGPGDVAPGGIGTVELDDGAVTPPKSGTGVTSNLVPDPGFNDAGWRSKRATPPWGFVDATSLGFTSADWAAYCSPTTARAVLSATGTGGVPVIPGESYFVAYDAARSGSGQGKFGLEVTFYDSSGNVITPTEGVDAQIDPLLTEVRDIASLPTATFDVRDGQVTIPPLVATLRVQMVRHDEVGTSAGNLFIDRIEVRSVLSRAGTGQRVETSPSGVIVFDQNGQPIGSINPDGSLSMVTGQFNDSLTYQGTELADWLNQRARGEVARVDAGFTASPSTSSEIEWLELGFTANSGRSYKIRSSGLIARAAGNRGLQVRWTTDGTRPLLSSPVLSTNTVGQNQTLYLASDLAWTDGTDREVKLLFTVQAQNGATGVYFDPADLGTGFSVWVEDVGARRDSSGGIVTPGEVEPVLETVTTTFASTWSQSWVAGNKFRSATSPPTMYQGYYDATSGDNASIFGFNYTALQAALAGSTIKKFEVYLYAEHWYYSAGGTVWLGTTPAATPPATGNYPSGTVTRRASWHLNKPEGRWVDIGAVGITIGNELRDGTSKSLLLDPRYATRSLNDYGRFSGAGTAAGRNPAIRITYEREVDS